MPNAWTTRQYAVEITTDRQLQLHKQEPDTKPDLRYMQGKVGGLIEKVQTEYSGEGWELDVWGNEEGKINGMPQTVYRRDGERLHGPLLVLASDPNGDSQWLTMAEAARIMLVQMVDFDLPLLRVVRYPEPRG